MFRWLILGLLVCFHAVAQVPAQTLPQFEFYRIDHSSLTNKDVPKNKKIFFLFFDTECDHCHQAIEQIARQYDAFKNTNVYLVSTNSTEQILQTVKTYGPGLVRHNNVTLLHDSKQQFIDKFKPRRYPSMYLYTPDGNLIGYEDNELTVFRIVRLLKS